MQNLGVRQTQHLSPDFSRSGIQYPPRWNTTNDADWASFSANSSFSQLHPLPRLLPWQTLSQPINNLEDPLILQWSNHPGVLDFPQNTILPMYELIPDIWYSLWNISTLPTCKHSPRSLPTPSESRARTFVTAIGARQAQIILRRRIKQDDAKVQIRGNGKEVFSNRLVRFPVSFYSSYQKVKTEFVSTSSSQVTMISAGRCLRLYDPIANSAEPAQTFPYSCPIFVKGYRCSYRPWKSRFRIPCGGEGLGKCHKRLRSWETDFNTEKWIKGYTLQVLFKAGRTFKRAIKCRDHGSISLETVFTFQCF